MHKEPRILVIDDNKDILNFIRAGLENRGYKIFTATSAEQAFLMTSAVAPDLILLDVVLPGLDGLQACRQFKQMHSSFVPIILVTVKRDLETKIQGTNHGADEFLTKPFLMEELHTKVRSMLRIKSLHDRLQYSSVTDPLTGVFNRRYFQPRLNEECDRSLRNKKTFSCLMFDLDHFKKVNDTYGHLFGDSVLKHFVATIRSLTRRTDLLFRYGGEEFILVLPETPLEKGIEMGELIRVAADANPTYHNREPIIVTCSVGVCGFPTKTIQDYDRLLKCLDDALYKAKKSGRNCLRVFKGKSGSDSGDLLAVNT